MVIIKYSQCNSLYQRISVPWNGKNKQRRGFALRFECNTKFLNGTYPSMATQVRLAWPHSCHMLKLDKLEVPDIY